MNEKKEILVLCTGNSCRSQMAEGYLRLYAGNKANIYSAGIEAHGVNPIAVKVMEEDGVNISHHSSTNVDKYAGKEFDIVITVCDNARESCPVFPGKAQKLHHSFPDPAVFSGSDEERMVKFRKVRDLIKSFCQQFVKENL